MEDGDFHGFMKEYMEKTCPSKNGVFGNWCAFEEELNKYRNLSKALKMCGCYSPNLDTKIDEVTNTVKELKQYAKHVKQQFNEKSTKERVEFSFKHWLYGTASSDGVRQRAKGVSDET